MNELTYRVVIDRLRCAIEVKALTQTEAEYKICDLLGYESLTELCLFLSIQHSDIQITEI